jgi:hypothetical protein
MTYAKTLEEFYASTISKAERNDDERTLSLKYFDFSKINVMITGMWTNTKKFPLG